MFNASGITQPRSNLISRSPAAAPAELGWRLVPYVGKACALPQAPACSEDKTQLRQLQSYRFRRQLPVPATQFPRTVWPLLARPPAAENRHILLQPVDSLTPQRMIRKRELLWRQEKARPPRAPVRLHRI